MRYLSRLCGTLVWLSPWRCVNWLRVEQHQRSLQLARLEAERLQAHDEMLAQLAREVVGALQRRDSELLDAMQAPTQLLSSWLDGFKVTGPVPDSATVRDSDELAAQSMRELEQDLPVDFTVPRIQI